MQRRFAIKRAFDFVAALLGLLLAGPLIILLALMVRLDSPGPAIFRQLRVGRNGVGFYIRKLRTMQIDSHSENSQITVGNDPRITRLGHWLRKWKLDELPQLWNVLVGDMSFVGPRPEVPKYVALYPSGLREKVLSIRPGITDPCSIILRNESDLLDASSNPYQFYIDELIPEKLKVAEEYIENQSFFGDLKIILGTILAVAQHDGDGNISNTL